MSEFKNTLTKENKECGGYKNTTIKNGGVHIKHGYTDPTIDKAVDALSNLFNGIGRLFRSRG